METNKKSYVVYRMALMRVILNDPDGHCCRVKYLGNVAQINYDYDVHVYT